MIISHIEKLQLLSRAQHKKLHNEEKGRDPATGRIVGKKIAGRLLDGREWNEFPQLVR